MKKKLIIIGILLFVLVGIVVLIPKEDLILIKTETNVEYGEILNTNLEEYIDVSKIKCIDDVKIDLKKVTEGELSIDDIDYKEKLEVGEYKLSFTYKNKNTMVNVNVNDTKSPNFIEPLTEIKVEQNALNVDFSKFFKANDLSEFRIKVDDTKIDLSKLGNYTLEVSAIDKYNNESKITVKVIVVDLEEARSKNGVTKTLDGTVFKSKDNVEITKNEQTNKDRVNSTNKNNSANNNASNSTSNNSPDKNVSSGTMVENNNEEDKITEKEPVYGTISTENKNMTSSYYWDFAVITYSWDAEDSTWYGISYRDSRLNDNKAAEIAYDKYDGPSKPGSIDGEEVKVTIWVYIGD